jgi:hypothetical protein
MGPFNTRSKDFDDDNLVLIDGSNMVTSGVPLMFDGTVGNTDQRPEYKSGKPRTTLYYDEEIGKLLFWDGQDYREVILGDPV